MQSKKIKIEAQEAVGQLLYYHVYTTCLEPAFSLESFGLTEDGSYPCTMGSRGEVLDHLPSEATLWSKEYRKEKSKLVLCTHVTVPDSSVSRNMVFGFTKGGFFTPLVLLKSIKSVIYLVKFKTWNFYRSFPPPSKYLLNENNKAENISWQIWIQATHLSTLRSWHLALST